MPFFFVLWSFLSRLIKLRVEGTIERRDIWYSPWELKASIDFLPPAMLACFFFFPEFEADPLVLFRDLDDIDECLSKECQLFTYLFHVFCSEIHSIVSHIVTHFLFFYFTRMLHFLMFFILFVSNIRDYFSRIGKRSWKFCINFMLAFLRVPTCKSQQNLSS